jgi:hypothetical protein
MSDSQTPICQICQRDHWSKDCPHLKEPSSLAAMPGSEMHLWRVDWKISSKPVRVIWLGDGKIKVIASCRIEQKIDEGRESYHDTYNEAMMRFLTNAQRDVNDAKKKLAKAQSRLKAANRKWVSYVASPNADLNHGEDTKQ